MRGDRRASWAASIAALLLLLLTGTTGRSAQAPIDPTVSPVRVDAVIGDARGLPFPGLRPADIELLEDGVPRPLEHVHVHIRPEWEGSAAILTRIRSGLQAGKARS
jgi:hypothetical protein